MNGTQIVATNVARLRADRDLTQEELAEKAGLSRETLGKVERGDVLPRSDTLSELAAALKVPVAQLVTEPYPLQGVRFREKKRVNTREQILADVAQWLATYNWLEKKLGAQRTFKPEQLIGKHSKPEVLARKTRKLFNLNADEPVRDICGLLEDNGVKVLLLEKRSDAFFGLSVAPHGGGPAVIVNTWDRISVERWVFTAAHELGHILLHHEAFDRSEESEEPAEEKEADRFASELLMPQASFKKEWEQARGLTLLERVLKVKRIFRVSYKTVLLRLVETKVEDRTVWQRFQAQHKRHFGKTLKKADEPRKMSESEFGLNWSRAGEPDGLSEFDFLDDRLSRLVREALESKAISLSRGAEILGLSAPEMRELAASWAS